MSEKINWKQEYRVQLVKRKFDNDVFVFLFLAVLALYSPLFAFYAAIFFAFVCFCGMFFVDEKLKRLGLELEEDKKNGK